MVWTLSRFRAGDLVEVCSKEEILATLDEQGCVDGMPFMPEMLRFCGRRVRVRAVAHKACETARQTWKGRRLRTTVHLDDLRCDGSEHGGCEATCSLFWKDVWLRPVAPGAAAKEANGNPGSRPLKCDEAQLLSLTQSNRDSNSSKPCYACQATKLNDASEPLPWWDLRQYAFDVVTGNHSIGRVLKVTWLATVRQPWRLLRRIPILRSFYVPFNEGMHRLFAGREAPYLFKNVKPVAKTPTGRIDLKPGELVRVKSKDEIEATLDANGQNRGLAFDPEEMARHCGGTFRVQRLVTRILDELTGEMRPMKQPCIILEGVVCQSEFARCRLNCPRAIPSYWRELWLERVNVVPPIGKSPQRQEDLTPAAILE